jgi:hypothetical protein
MQKNPPITKTLPRGMELLDNPNLNKGTASKELNCTKPDISK